MDSAASRNSPFPDHIDTLSRAIGIGLIAYVFIVYALSVLLFAVGSGITAYTVWIAFPLSCAVVATVAIREGAGPVAAGSSGLLATLLILAAILSSGLIYDVSWDGISYHQEAVIQLTGGWNPIRDHLGDEVRYALWLNHYPKLSWIFAADHYAAFGNIESGKSYTLILAMALAFLLFGTLRRFADLDWQWRVVVTVLVVANPVLINQMFNYYVDGLIYVNFGLTCVIAAYAIAERKYYWYGLLCAVAILLVNTKFTGAPYFVLISACAAIYLAIFRNFREASWFALITFASFLIAILFGYDSYIKNALEHGHPLYPLYGTGAVDIMTREFPVGLHDLSAPMKFIASLFSVVSIRAEDILQLRMPFILSSRDELTNSAVYDIRLSGFGFWFSGIFVVAISALTYAGFSKKGNYRKGLGIFLVIALLATVLINPQSWWARYVPQLWLLPVLAIVLLRLIPTRQAAVLSGFLVVIMLVNSSVILGEVLRFNYHATSQIRGDLYRIRASNDLLPFRFGEFEAVRARLDYNQIRFSVVPEKYPLPCSDGRTLQWTYGRVQYCYGSEISAVQVASAEY